MSRRRSRGTLVAALATAGLLGAASTAAAEPAVQAPIDDVTESAWTGGVAGAAIGSSAFDVLGDVNGDDVSDVLVSTEAPRRGVTVLFGPPDPETDLTDLDPSEGYTIVGETNYPVAATRVGDQNDDGLADVLMRSAFAGQELAVVYGIEDPSALPQCEAPAANRCLNLATLTTSQGYKLANGGQVFKNVGDFNGDGVDDFGVQRSSGTGGVQIVYGGRTPSATPLDLNNVPVAEGVFVQEPAAGSGFGSTLEGVGDINQDGRDDFASATSPTAPQAGTYIIYGVADADAPITTSDLGTEDGFRVNFLAGLTLAQVGGAGDVNGDGRPDLVSSMISLFAPPGRMLITYGPETTPATPINAHAPTPEQGYELARGDGNAAESQFPVLFANIMNSNDGTPSPIGDLNGDGVPDFILGDPQSPTGDFDPAGTGMTHVVFGKDPRPSAGAVFDETLTPDQGISLLGDTANGALGMFATPAGDSDEDGLPDFYTVAPNVSDDEFAGSGTVHFVSGAQLVANAGEGEASDVTHATATVTADADPNGRDSTAYIEWGKTTDYGNQTAEQEISGDDPQDVSAELEGLEPSTTYHYRLVVVNDLGLTRYGPDATFTTQATPPPPDGDGDGVPDAQDQCPSQAGPASNNGCPEQPRTGEAELALSVTPKSKKAGKAAKFTATLRNTGDGAAENARVCLKAPKKALEGSKCKQLGELAAGAQGKAKFKVKPTSKAKSGKSYTLKFKASAAGVKADKATAKVEIK